MSQLPMNSGKTLQKINPIEAELTPSKSPIPDVSKDFFSFFTLSNYDIPIGKQKAEGGGKNNESCNSQSEEESKQLESTEKIETSKDIMTKQSLLDILKKGIFELKDISSDFK